jgi:hypothetical protein
MTGEELTALYAEIVADLEDLTARQEAVTAKLKRLNTALTEQDPDPATVHELHPR